MKEFTNKDRADVMAPFVEAFSAEMFRHPAGEDVDTVTGDFLADFFHWCTQQGMEPDDVISRALEHYNEEIAEEQQP